MTFRQVCSSSVLLELLPLKHTRKSYDSFEWSWIAHGNAKSILDSTGSILNHSYSIKHQVKRINAYMHKPWIGIIKAWGSPGFFQFSNLLSNLWTSWQGLINVLMNSLGEAQFCLWCDTAGLDSNFKTLCLIFRLDSLISLDGLWCWTLMDLDGLCYEDQGSEAMVVPRDSVSFLRWFRNTQ